jgi:hypothetical protein
VGATRALLSAALMLMAGRHGGAQNLYDPSHLELRAGYLMGVVVPFFKASRFPERGTSDANLELVLPKFWRARGWREALLSRLQLGATVNLDSLPRALSGAHAVAHPAAAAHIVPRAAFTYTTVDGPTSYRRRKGGRLRLRGDARSWEEPAMMTAHKRKPHIGDMIDTPVLQLLPVTDAAAPMLRGRRWPYPQVLLLDSDRPTMEPHTKQAPGRLH